ncbi:hypothetical protein ABEI33_14015 [Pantoea agglomerans]
MSYLKIKLQAERTIALNFEKALAELHQTMLDTGRGIVSGAQREAAMVHAFLMTTRMFVINLSRKICDT